jgi:hypothetical protein
MKTDLLNMRLFYPSQLLPFHGLRGFGNETEYLNGAIFLFLPDKLAHSFGLITPVAEETIAAALDTHADEAEVSLLFTETISKIKYTVCSAQSRNDIRSKWVLERQFGLAESPTDSVLIESVITKKTCESSITPNKSVWQLAHSVSRMDGRRDGSKLATRVLFSVHEGSVPLEGMVFDGQCFFTIEGLPFHARLVEIDLTAERRHPLEEPFARTQAVRLYLELLAFLATEIGESAYDFWPRVPTGERAEGQFVEEFWETAAKSSLKLLVPVDARRQKDKHPALSFSGARFDITPDHISRALRKLLAGLEVTNIVRLGGLVSQALQKRKGMVDIQIVDAAYIRSLLKLPDAGCVLKDMWEEDNLSCQSLNKILWFILESQTSKELEGCTCLPLLNGTLGPIRLGKVDGMDMDGSPHEASDDSIGC